MENLFLFQQFTAQEIISLAPEVIRSVSYHWLVAIIFFSCLNTLIKYINEWFEDKNTQSMMGMVIITPITWGFFKWYYAYEEMVWLDVTLVVTGLIIGYFAYILGDIAEEVYQNKHIAIPLILGLSWGATWTISAKFNEWKQIDAQVLEIASQSSVDIYRYEYDSCCSRDDEGDCESCYKWVYQYSVGKTSFGYKFPKLVEGIDYTVGRGAFGKRDRVEHNKYRAYAIGDKEEYDWYKTWNANLEIEVDALVYLGLNFHNEIIREIGNGKSENTYTGHRKFNIEDPKKLFPYGPPEAKAIFTFVDFFKRLGTDEAYQPLRDMYKCIYGIMFILLFLEEFRQPAAIFIISSLIIPLLILLIIMGKSGSQLTDFTFWGPRPRWL